MGSILSALLLRFFALEPNCLSNWGGLSSNVVFVDGGGNNFRLYHIAHLARIHNLDPRQALEQIHLIRAFTAYQMTSFIMDHLKDAVEKYPAKFVVISDIAGLYLDKEVFEEEAR